MNKAGAAKAASDDIADDTPKETTMAAGMEQAKGRLLAKGAFRGCGCGCGCGCGWAVAVLCCGCGCTVLLALLLRRQK
jgi:hypothetical protein